MKGDQNSILQDKKQNKTQKPKKNKYKKKPILEKLRNKKHMTYRKETAERHK